MNKLIYTLLLLSLIPLTLLAQNSEEGGNLIEAFDPEIQRIKDSIQTSQDQINELQKQRKTYEENLKIKRQQINTLKNQIGILDDSIAKLVLEVQTTELQIEQSNLEIQNIELQIGHKEDEIDKQQSKISKVLNTINKNSRKKNNLEILILEGNLGNFFNEINQLQSLENTLSVELTGLNDLKDDLINKGKALNTRKEQLSNLHDKLLSNQERKLADQYVKGNLLDQTQGQEESFQSLLSQVKAEQAGIEAEIQNLEIAARRRLLETEGILPNDDEFIWPVPSRKVTAYFHDPDYPYRYIFEHPAIDVGDTPQGTPIRASRSGYVATVRFTPGSSAYGYILLVHPGGLSTVYGHISKPYVEEDNFVVQGEVIALSGGGPGTSGAGRLTTAPHLHFETRLNGIPVNPLNYLP